jgi:hypothetical protein
VRYMPHIPSKASPEALLYLSTTGHGESTAAGFTSMTAIELLILHYRNVKYLKLMLCESVWMSTKSLSIIYIFDPHGTSTALKLIPLQREKMKIHFTSYCNRSVLLYHNKQL